MRKNKKYYGLLAGVMALALATPFVGYNIAKADKLYDDVVAWYDFDGGALKNVKGGSQAVAIVKGLGNYDGEVKYDANRDETKDGNSLKLDGGYGLKLNQQNLGENFSVSLWVKPETKLVENQSVLFLGYHSPEMWYAVSGDRNNSQMKFWYDYKPNFSWVTKTFATYAPSEWHHIVITGDGNIIKSYYDGERISEGNENFVPFMAGEEQDIYIGANNWDKCFEGLVDDVMVYDRTLSEVDIERLFTGKSLKEVEEETGVVDYDNYLVGSYDFENGIGDAKAIVKGLGAYDGELKFVNGANGKALATDGYGLNLGNKVNGTDFTISYLVKPNKSQANNQVMMLMGYHAPEHWTAISGDGGDQTYKLWGRTEGSAVTVGNAAAMNWTTIGNPTIANNSWSLVTLVGTDGRLDMYVNGEKAAGGAYNNPLCGENESILFGANYWDPCFDGSFDEIRIYNRAMDAATIKAEAEKFLDNRLQTSLDAACDFEAIKGQNTDREHIRYNLELPTSVLGTSINWTSSKPEVISEKGVVTITDESSEVKLTATAELDRKKAIVEIELSVDALDKSELTALIERAKAFDLTFMSAESAGRLQEVIAEAEAAATFDEIDSATVRLTKAIETLELADEYVDPFDVIPEAEVTVSIEAGSNKDLFVLPETILNKVTVEYTSEDAAVAAYEDGKIVANKVGKTIVTATVKAVSDGFEMQYATAVDVTDKTPAPAPAPSSGSAPAPAPSSGSGSTGGSTASSGSSSSGSSASTGGQTTPATGTETATTITDPQAPAAGPQQPAGSQTQPGHATKPEASEGEALETSETDIESDSSLEEKADEETEVEADVEESVEQPAEETVVDEPVPEAGETAGLSAGAIAGIIAAVVAVLALLGFVLTKLGLLTIFK
ncbi:LamG-like jellyroll fold domain-containing protein [Pseudobutyrivibrio xylanivorans]|uniref:Concanavalin A-like lectin/glucanases superfamily protein n=1 Tax=Pseudobutyrivibrio xylanivorans TaxID=185007 RepID=A0A1G5RRR3_PSEXY|nr:LamG-like jellyroll fold domain-containing protein [Pseudobutyrivibrio xylanivorans]SCZ76783.1 Concanavalin A-like lectin/glucanases superfamily protein [Pseudobutyrivibrio xylanivorans]